MQRQNIKGRLFESQRIRREGQLNQLSYLYVPQPSPSFSLFPAIQRSKQMPQYARNSHHLRQITQKSTKQYHQINRHISKHSQQTYQLLEECLA
jgi:hypothetical protein